MLAKQISFTNAEGIACSASFWVLSQLLLNPKVRYAHIDYVGYATKQTYLDSKNPIGYHAEDIVGDPYDTYFSDSALASAGLVAQGYAVAATFFDGATDVNTDP